MKLNPHVDAATALLAQAARDCTPAAFACSFGAEDMVLVDLIASRFREIEIFTLDTGRLPPETYALMQLTAERYRRRITVYFPDTAGVESWVRINGINGFYESLAQRRQCCHVRKVEPLRRALAGKRGWITGLRREQALTRDSVRAREHDSGHGIEKFSPLLEWSQAEVWEYLCRHEVPYNALHHRGYPSIGCAPCTRPVEAGQDARSGRWWWETAETKECGLHAAAARRTIDSARHAPGSGPGIRDESVQETYSS